jgi:hypothetical protein
MHILLNILLAINILCIVYWPADRRECIAYYVVYVYWENFLHRYYCNNILFPISSASISS